jgi:hypothetical protein
MPFSPQATDLLILTLRHRSRGRKRNSDQSIEITGANSNFPEMAGRLGRERSPIITAL